MASRYAELDTETRAWRGRLVRGKQLRPLRSWVFHYTDHTWREGQRFDTVADDYYNDPTMWWQLADANPEILWWGSIEPGTQVRVPHV